MNEADQLLHDEILAAHAAEDGAALSQLYLQAADRKREAGDNAAVPFLLTQAYVFSLESGQNLAAELHRQLVILGSET